MTKTMKFGVLLGLVLLAAVAPGGWADASAGSMLLASRYTDEMSGFSIHPPKGGYRTKSDDASCLVRWICRKSNSDELLWSLSVHRSATKVVRSDIRQAGQDLAAELKKTGAKIDSPTFLTICSKPAVNFSGVLAGMSQVGLGGAKKKLPDTCFRQAWIQLQPGRFFVIKWDCVSSPRDFLDATWANILAGVELADPREIIRRKSENVRRSYELLWKTLTDEKIGQAMPAEPQWFLIRRADKPIGWLRIESRRLSRNQVAGFEIRTWAMYQMPEDKVRLVRKVMFTDPKLSLEHWQARIQVGSGRQAGLIVEEGLRQQDLIISTTYENDRKEQRQSKLPESVKKILLPKAVGMVLPKLLNLNKSVSYTFAEYNPDKNNFQMRTFKVIGPAEVNIGGRIIQAIKATDQPAANTLPIILWLDAKGNILRSRAPNGIDADTATRKQILKIFPKAETVIRQINQASRKRSAHKKSKRNQK